MFTVLRQLVVMFPEFKMCIELHPREEGARQEEEEREEERRRKEEHEAEGTGKGTVGGTSRS